MMAKGGGSWGSDQFMGLENKRVTRSISQELQAQARQQEMQSRYMMQNGLGSMMGGTIMQQLPLGSSKPSPQSSGIVRNTTEELFLKSLIEGPSSNGNADLMGLVASSTAAPSINRHSSEELFQTWLSTTASEQNQLGQLPQQQQQQHSPLQQHMQNSQLPPPIPGGLGNRRMTRRASSELAAMIQQSQAQSPSQSQSPFMDASSLLAANQWQVIHNMAGGGDLSGQSRRNSGSPSKMDERMGGAAHHAQQQQQQGNLPALLPPTPLTRSRSNELRRRASLQGLQIASTDELLQRIAMRPELGAVLADFCSLSTGSNSSGSGGGGSGSGAPAGMASGMHGGGNGGGGGLFADVGGMQNCSLGSLNAAQKGAAGAAQLADIKASAKQLANQLAALSAQTGAGQPLARAPPGGVSSSHGQHHAQQQQQLGRASGAASATAPPVHNQQLLGRAAPGGVPSALQPHHHPQHHQQQQPQLQQQHQQQQQQQGPGNAPPQATAAAAGGGGGGQGMSRADLTPALAAGVAAGPLKPATVPTGRQLSVTVNRLKQSLKRRQQAMLQQEPTPPPPPPAAAAAAAREHEDHHHPQQQQQQQQVLKGGGGKGDSLLAAAAPPAVVPPETPAAAPAAAAAGVGAGAPAALQLLQQQPQPLPTSSAVSRPPPVPPGPLRLGVSPESSMAPSGAPSPTISMTAGMTPQSSPRDGGHGTLTFDSLTVNDPMEGAAAASAGAAEMHAPAATTIGGTKRTLPDGVAAAKQPSKRATSGTTGSVVPPGGVIPGWHHMDADMRKAALTGSVTSGNPKAPIARSASVTSSGTSAHSGGYSADPSRHYRNERQRKLAEAKGRSASEKVAPTLDPQALKKRVDFLETEVRGLKQYRDFMNRKDSEHTKKIESLEKENERLAEENELLLQELARFRGPDSVGEHDMCTDM